MLLMKNGYVQEKQLYSPLELTTTPEHEELKSIATIMLLGDNRTHMVFDEPQFSIKPGQAAVWYSGDIVLGVA